MDEVELGLLYTGGAFGSTGGGARFPSLLDEADIVDGPLDDVFLSQPKFPSVLPLHGASTPCLGDDWPSLTLEECRHDGELQTCSPVVLSTGMETWPLSCSGGALTLSDSEAAEASEWDIISHGVDDSRRDRRGSTSRDAAHDLQGTNTTENAESRESATSEQPRQPSRKRARAQGGRAPDDHMQASASPSEHDELPHKTRKTKPSADERNRVILACPFYKRDPARYRSCRRFFLTKISYVKQHILRSHRMPPHCQICNSLFQTDEQQLEHVRSQSCDRQPYNPPEGVTQAQIALLRGRVDQKKSLEGQWYEIYDILFPGAQRPSSVYLDPELSQDLDEFTNFLTSRGPTILLNRVNLGRIEPAAPSGESLVSEVSSALQEVYDVWYRGRTVTAQPSLPLDRPPSLAGSNANEPSSFTSAAASTSPAGRLAPAAKAVPEGRPPPPPPAPTTTMPTFTAMKRVGDADRAGEHRRKSPRPADYQPGGVLGPGSVAEQTARPARSSE
jgi:hypothetical protein